MIRIVLVDDQRMSRQITRRLLSMHADVTVVGEARDGIEALEVVSQARPDVVLMDVHMPILNGVETTKRMRSAYPDVKIVLFSSINHDSYVAEGMRAGAIGYLPKNTQPDVLVAAIRAASEGRQLDARHATPTGCLSSRQRG
ncbi:MAG: response regulator transcription factor [Chloroflexi bacterium]|nr:response regulator transcription factor [Chloroflexota bacterium]